MAQDLVGFLVNRHLMPLLMEFGGMKPGAAWSGQPFGGSANAREKAGKAAKKPGSMAETKSRKAAERSPESPRNPRNSRKGAR